MPNKTFKDILISLLQDTVLCRCLKRLKEAFLNQKRGHLGINRHYYLKPKKSEMETYHALLSTFR